VARRAGSSGGSGPTSPAPPPAGSSAGPDRRSG
jgi:hypothetical protein